MNMASNRKVSRVVSVWKEDKGASGTKWFNEEFDTNERL
jgi:hypothetical protein